MKINHASAFVGDFNIKPYNDDGSWNGSWSSGDAIFYKTGTYSFKVSENETGKGGVTYDGAKYTVTYTVTKTTSAAGEAILNVAKEVKKDGTTTNDSINFTNTYNPVGNAPVTAKKDVKSVGCDIPEGVTFSFKAEIAPTTGVTPQSLEGSATTSGTGKTTDELTVTFSDPGKFTFTRPGTYTVTFSETGTPTAGWAFDSNTVDVSVTVTDKGDGTLSVSPEEIGTDVKFTNTYNPAPAESTMSGNKTYKDTDTGESLEFNEGDFKAKVEADAGNPEGGATLSGTAYSGGTYNVIPSSTEKGKGTWSLGSNISFSKVGTYTYTVNETNQGKWGVKYDVSKYTVTYTVTDEGTGQLLISTEVKKDGQKITGENPQLNLNFANTYKEFKKDYNNAGIAPEKVMYKGKAVAIGDTINYQINSGNFTENPNAYVSFKDKASAGLEFVKDSFYLKVGENDPVNVAPTFDEQTNTFTYKTDTLISIPINVEVVLTYSATVTSAALTTHTINNEAYGGVENDPTMLVGSLPNTVGEKTYAQPDVIKIGDAVEVGQEIDYKIVAKNLTGADGAKINFKDTASTGLVFNDNSFKLSVNGAVPQTVVPTIKENTATVTASNIEKDAEVVLTYKATVTSDALVEHKVKNDAYIGVNDNPTTFVGSLPNTVPEKKYVPDEQGNTLKPGDAVEVGQIIPYEIDATNETGSDSAYIIFKDQTSTGLELNKESFVLKINDVEVKPLSFTTLDTHNFELKIENVEAGAKAVLTYTATVTNEALEQHTVKNDAVFGVNHEPTTKAGSLPNTVGEKTYANPDDIKIGDAVKIGQVIDYKITTKNLTGSVNATINFKDTTSAGLVFDANSFKISINDGEATTVTPTIHDKKATYSAEGVAKDAKVVLTYSATVTSEALVTHTVNNDAYIGVNHEPTTSAGSLPNTVPEKKYVPDEEGKTLKPGDAVEVGQTIPYEIDATNKTGATASIKFEDTTSAGLVLNKDSFKIKIGTAEAISVTVTDISYNHFSYTATNIADSDSVALTYTATVTAAALNEKKVQNNVVIYVNDRPRFSVDPLINTVGEKTYAEPDEIKVGDAVEVGQDIDYKIVTKNLTGTDGATINFKDIASQGLNFNKNSFKLSIDEEEPTAIKPVIKDNTATVAATNIPNDAQVTLTYAASVTSDAHVTHTINNDAYIGVNADANVFVGSLPNTVPEKNYVSDEEGNTLKPGDAVEVGQTIPYEIVATNKTGANNAYVSLKDTTSTGLELNKDSFKLKINGVEAELPTFAKLNAHNFELVVHNVSADAELILTYTATVTKDALIEGKVQNDAYLGVDHEPTSSAGSLPNPVPEKTYDDGHTQDDVLNVGDTISYKIKAQNCTGDIAYIVFKDNVSKGLSYNKGSFKLTVIDEDGKTVKSVSVSPEINENIFTYKAKNIANNYKLELTYSCTVTEDAYETLTVNNGASIGVNSDPDFELNTLKNPVNDKPLYVDANSGDSLNIWLILGLIAAALAAGVVIVGGNFRRKSERN